MNPIEALRAARPLLQFEFCDVTYYLRQPTLRQAESWTNDNGPADDDQETTALHKMISGLWCDAGGALVNPTVADIEESPVGFLKAFQATLGDFLSLDKQIEQAAKN